MKKLMRNAAVLAAGGLFSKALGALYRIPLTNILGAEGIGVYQMVFPFYTVLLTLSSTGIPSGLSRLTADGKVDALKRSIAFFGSLGLLGSVVMFFGAQAISSLQGNIAAAGAYRALSPSVAAVSLISCFRGYFQGKFKTFPTALSQVVEQLVKLAFGLFVCYNFGSTAAEKAAFAALAVTVSELFALLLLVFFRREKTVGATAPSVKALCRAVFPITLSSIMLPLSKTADGFISLNLMGGGAKATAMLGLYGGVVESVVSLPVSLCYALAVSGIPFIAKGGEKNGAKVIKYTLFLSVILAALTFVFSELIINILYPKLTPNETITAVNLLKISSLSVIGLSLTQAFSATFIGKGRLFVSPICLGAGVIAKIASTFLLVSGARLNVYGCAFSDIICYLVASFSFLLYIIKEYSIKKKVDSPKDEKENEAFGYRAWRQKRRRFS